VNCEICKNKLFLVKTFNKPQKNEKIFTSLKKFKKNIYKCKLCGHHNIKSYDYKLNDKIYKNDYGVKAYGNLFDKFKKINNLKKNESTNFYRKKFVLREFNLKKTNKLLDYGSGLGIFPYSIRKSCKCFFYEKDRISRKFCIKFLFLKFISLKKLKKNYFHFITCNKVLEHLNFKDILKCLKIFKKTLKKEGKIYIELPSTDAVKKGYKRQEFFSEHLNVFSKKSAQIFFSAHGFTVNKLISVEEIGNKFTLRIILSKKL
tara:strand:+ start:162 stop:941 length:780 start_codon:yes stop_codon:yes gene_type:complete